MQIREALIGRLFVELADTLVDGFDVVDTLHRLADSCVALFAIDAAGVMLADRRGTLRPVACSPKYLEALGIVEVQTDEGPCLDAFRTGQPVLNVSVAEARARWPLFSEAAQSLQMRSTHALPLGLRGEVIGAMNLFSTSSDCLSEADQALCQALADVATIGLLQQRAIRDRSVVADQLQTALSTRILVEQAKGVLAERTGLSPADTFVHLRGYARRTGQLIHIVAQQVIDGRLATGLVIPQHQA